MHAACKGLATIVCIGLVGNAFGQTSTTTRTSGGGYFVQFGESEGASPARHNLIPPPTAPVPASPSQPMMAAATTGMALNPANPTLAQTPIAPIPMQPTSVQPIPMQAVPAAEPHTASPAEMASGPIATPGTPVPTPAQLTHQDPQPVPALSPHLPTATRANATEFPLPEDLRMARQQAMRLSQVQGQPNLTSPTAAESYRKSTLISATNPAPTPTQHSVSSLITGCEDCETGCDNCEIGCEPLCCGRTWEHFTTVYASALYMRPRNADVPYAVPIDGPISTIPTNPIQVGQVDLVDPDYDTAYNVGFNLAVNALTSVAVEYISLESSTSNRVSTSAPNVLRSLVSHPSSTSAAADFLNASASLGIDFQTLDVSLRHLFVGGEVFAVNYIVGARYGRLEQDFGSRFFDNGTETVDANVDFDGAGLRLGLETEQRACNHCVFFYSRTAASFLAGKFQTSYRQGQTFDPTVVRTSWEAGRVVPILDLELGGGWSSKCGRFKLSAGYVFSAWFNTVKTDDFIQAVQQNDFNDLSETMTFDGIVGRAEFSF